MTVASTLYVPFIAPTRSRRNLRQPVLIRIFVGLIAATTPVSWPETIDAADGPRNLGLFNSAADVGQIELPGTAEFVSDSGEYRIRGSGANIWFNEDAFQFVYKQTRGDLVFRMDVAWVGAARPGVKLDHRKACAMVRQTLDADSPYVDVAVHGDGLIALQYRTEKGGLTYDAKTPIKAPATVKLERDANVFTVSVASDGKTFQPVGSVEVAMTDPVYTGLAVCSHDASVTETAVFSNVELTERVAKPGEQRVRETSLETLDVKTGERKLVHRERSSFEAPNWSPDGRTFFVNRQGTMATVPTTGGEMRLLDTGEITGCNNDHGLSFDGKWLAISAAVTKKMSKIYVLPAAGGTPQLVTPLGPSYWHGWSPDGATLTYCAKRDDEFDIYTIPAAGGEERRLTTAEGLDDGPEYTPDGKKIYFHSERTGIPQVWRMNIDGGEQEQITFDPNFADWFPHVSPDGTRIVFISYDKTVVGHPANKNVVLRMMPTAGGKPKTIATLFGGQGTMNVPSWSPDGKQIAFVSYRYVLP